MRSLSLFLLLAGLTMVLHAADSSEQFLGAYQAYQQGERAEREGGTADALKNYRYAESLLQSISEKDPSWQKSVVEYRLKKTRDALSRLGASSPEAGSLGDTPNDPSAGDSAESSSRERKGPSISISPPGETSSRPPQSRRTGEEVIKLRKTVETLQAELKTARDAALSEQNHSEDLNKMQWTKDKSLLEEELTKARDEIATLREQVRQRESWSKDLKDLQKRLDDAIADKASTEEYYQQREKRSAEAVAELNKQIEEARTKIAQGGENGRKVEELSKRVEKDAESLKQLQAQLDQATQASKESQTKSALLESQIKQASEKLSAAEKKAGELAPLREKLSALHLEAESAKTAADIAGKKSEELQTAIRKRDADVAVLQEERDSLGQQIQHLGKAAKEASKVKGLETEAAELRNKVAGMKDQADSLAEQANDARKKLLAAETASQSAAKKMEDLSSSISADRAVLEEEKRQLEQRLNDANGRITSLGDKLGATQGQEKEITALREKLEANAQDLQKASQKMASMERDQAAAKSDAERKLAAAQVLKEAVQNQNASLQLQLKDALGRMEGFIASSSDSEAVKKQLADLKQQLDENNKNYQESQKKLADLSSVKPEQEAQLRQKQTELDASRAEADKLRGDLQNANRRITDLQAETAKGQDRLKSLQDQLANLTAKQATPDKSTDELRKQLVESEAQVASLKKKKGVKGSVADAKTAEENAILRGIILRQVKEEAKRAQSRRLMDEEMKKLNVQSQTFSDQLAVLSAPVVVLTPEERALFKDEHMVVIEGDSGSMQAAVAAPLDQSNAPSSGTSESSTNAVPSSSTPAPIASETKTGDSAKEIPWQGKLKQCLSRAKEEFDRQDYLQAESSFREALGYSPDDYFTLSNLGVVEFQLGKLKEAEEALSKAVQTKSDSSFALTTLGIVYYRQQRSDEAEKTLRKAIAVNEQDFTAHNYLGIVLAASGKGAAGESEIMKAIEINKNYADAHFNLAVIYATGKPPSKMMARKHYAKALELGAPPDPSLEHLVQ